MAVEATSKPESVSKPSRDRKSRKKAGKKAISATMPSPTPVKPIETPVQSPTPVSTPVNNSATTPTVPTPVSTPVKPEVVYQEKSVVEIYPSHNQAPLDRPVNRPEHYAEKDNSSDGFLAIKH